MSKAARLKGNVYQTLIDGSQSGIYVVQAGRFCFVNPQVQEWTGYSEAELLEMDPWQLVHPEDREQVRQDAVDMLMGRRCTPYEYRTIAKNGEVRWVLESVTPIEYGGERASLGSCLHITEQKRVEQGLAHAKRVYSVLSGINQVIIRLRDPEKLFHEACRIAVETGKFRMAWVGLVDPDTLAVKPVAHWGLEAGYLDGIVASAADVPEGRGPTGFAIREGKHFICNDVEHDPRMLPWRGEALKRGYRSCIALPLREGARIVGAFNIHASELDFFDDEEVRLLDELAADISFALEHIEQEKRLRASEERHRLLLGSISDAVFVLDREYRFTMLNSAMEQAAQMPGGNMLGNKITDLFPNLKGSLFNKAFRQVMKTRAAKTVVDEYTFTKGRKAWYEVHAYPVPEGVLVASIDVTERRQAQQRLQESTLKLREAFEGAIKAMASATEIRDPYTAGHQRRVAELSCAVASEIGLTEERTEGLRMAGLIHDIGKIGVPTDILSKPGSLTEMEFSIVKTHSRMGYDILKEIEFPWPIAQMVYQHHERVNGSGYPLRLKGEDILIEAKILGVADVAEAISSHRPYRPSLGRGKALEEISEKRGVLYDPTVVDAFLKVFADMRFDEPESRPSKVW